MATRILGPTGGRRRRRILLFAPLLAVVAMVIAMSASGGAIGTAAGFEDDDGNLTPEAPINFDWNSFSPTTWTGTAPNRLSTKITSGWTFNGIEDAQATTSDSAFPGGTKQDNECPLVGTAKAPNKDDLKRIYIANKTVNGHVYLELAWVRIPQNTTSASAHVAFEFNQGTTTCGAGSDGLVHRTDGDMLIVYDFEGGAGAPVIKLERWTTDPLDPCEVGSNSPPCWGPATDLTASGFAEAKVNTGVTVSDTIGPSSPTAENLGDSEFGEAGIDLTGAGVFSEDVCTGFGKAFGVSRSSGQSSTAQMKDLVGPANINITNCGRVIIRKVTVPSPDPTDTTFSYTTTGSDLSSFTLKNGDSKDFGSTVHAGNKTVTESDPGTNFVLTSIDCSASSVTHGSTFSTDTSTRTATFTLAAQDTIDCTYTNTLQTGAIKVTKTRKHAADGPGDHPHAGVSFTVNGVTKQTDANGVACFDGLIFGSYTVHETVPTGYHVDANDKSVTVDNTATCADSPYGGESVSFHNTPLTNITMSVDSQVDGGTASTIDCDGVTGSTGTNGDGSVSENNLEPGTYTCTVVVDP